MLEAGQGSGLLEWGRAACRQREEKQVLAVAVMWLDAELVAGCKHWGAVWDRERGSSQRHLQEARKGLGDRDWCLLEKGCQMFRIWGRPIKFVLGWLPEETS